jgi:hypothetical protein
MLGEMFGPLCCKCQEKSREDAKGAKTAAKKTLNLKPRLTAKRGHDIILYHYFLDED